MHVEKNPVLQFFAKRIRDTVYSTMYDNYKVTNVEMNISYLHTLQKMLTVI